MNGGYGDGFVVVSFFSIFKVAIKRSPIFKVAIKRVQTKRAWSLPSVSNFECNSIFKVAFKREQTKFA